MIRGLLVFLILAIFSVTARAGTFYEGLQAYNVGDYREAATIWRPLALQNDGNAQSGLGLLYYKGLGIDQNLPEALRWFSLGANNGVVQSQMFLCIMTWQGHGIRRSPVWAYMWCDLVVTAGLMEAIQMRDEIEAEMTEQQIARARNLVARWHSAHSPRE